MSAASKPAMLLPGGMAKAGWDLATTRVGYDFIAFGEETPEAEFRNMLQNCEAICLWGRPLTAEDIAAAPRLKVVSRLGMGVDAVDIPALTARGIPLLTSDTANSNSVAEMTLFFMLHLARQGTVMHEMVKAGRWNDRYEPTLTDLAGKTALIVGFGRIGSRLAKRLNAMEMAVIAFDPFVTGQAMADHGVRKADDLEAAIPEADYVIIICPKSPATIDLFDARRIGLMKPSAFLISTSRGGIINEDALYAALTTGVIAGAGLDVFAHEPVPADHPIPHLPNVITAPHMAGGTREALDNLATFAVLNAFSVLDGKPATSNVVNPEVLAS